MKRAKLLALLLAATTAQAQQRQEQVLADGWQFFAVESGNEGRTMPAQQWQTVSVPHDWAIGGPFDKKWDLQVVRIEQNGEKEPTEKSGRSGALPWIGEGHYKRSFTIPSGFKGHAELVFDGAMAEPTVVINGQKAGYWAYGYNTFRIDATPFVHEGENQLAVDLKNVEESSRWYPGAGLYRPVTLVLTPTPTHIDDWSTFVRTTTLDNGKGQLELLCETRIEACDKAKELRLRWRITDPQGQSVSEKESTVGSDGKVRERFGWAWG